MATNEATTRVFVLSMALTIKHPRGRGKLLAKKSDPGTQRLFFVGLAYCKLNALAQFEQGSIVDVLAATILAWRPDNDRSYVA